MSERVRRACEALHACEHSGYPVGSTFTMCSRCGAVRNERAPRPEWTRAPLVQALVDALNAEAPIEPGDISRARFDHDDPLCATPGCMHGRSKHVHGSRGKCDRCACQGFTSELGGDE
jgi:hypothetical protein